MPKCTEELMQEQFKKWSQMVLFGHFSSPVPWAHVMSTALRVFANWCQSQEIAMMECLTVNIHLLLTAFYKQPPKTQNIVRGQSIPSDHYAIESQIRLHGLDTAESMICLKPKE
uniref:Uncharacterized protein n=1 Tax=Ditylenchus dipsaci TaxID=166011 RepID=A0A915EMZ3_9BILA